MNFIIDVYMQNGDVWRTVRRSKQELEDMIQCILTDENVAKFTVEDK